MVSGKDEGGNGAWWGEHIIIWASYPPYPSMKEFESRLLWGICATIAEIIDSGATASVVGENGGIIFDQST